MTANRKKHLVYIYQIYQWIFYVPFIFLNTLIFGIVAVIVSIVVNQKAGSYWGGVVWSRVNALFVPMLVKVQGKEKIEKDRSYIIMANHQSYFDIFLMYGWLGLDIKWVMKKDLAKVPGLGFGAKKVGHIFLDRSNKRNALKSLEEARKRLAQGSSVVIFPEGTRSETGKIGNFKRGGFKLAYDLNLPILPITLENTKNILPAKSLMLFPGKVKMTVHNPITVNTMDFKEFADLIPKVKEIIQSGMKC